MIDGGPTNPLWVAKVNLFKLYHTQIASTLTKGGYSLPEYDTRITGNPGVPWANLPAFTDDQPTTDYPILAQQYFDGIFEQAHDNYHGWVGPDMADNSYTAFDPIFLSYHANMDRIVEMYIRSAQTPLHFTSNFPLQPFIEYGTDVSYSNPRVYVYTTLGDMAKPTQALNYLYAPPATPDYVPIQKSLLQSRKMPPSGGTVVPTMRKDEAQYCENNIASKITADSTQTKNPYVVFQGVSCTKESYHVDVFVPGARSLEPDPVANSHFIGRVTRLGMGPGRRGRDGLQNPERCVKNPITRVLDATRVKDRLEGVKIVKQVVTEIASGKVVEPSEWTTWPGFNGRLAWG